MTDKECWELVIDAANTLVAVGAVGGALWAATQARRDYAYKQRFEVVRAAIVATHVFVEAVDRARIRLELSSIEEGNEILKPLTPRERALANMEKLEGEWTPKIARIVDARNDLIPKLRECQVFWLKEAIECRAKVEHITMTMKLEASHYVKDSVAAEMDTGRAGNRNVHERWAKRELVLYKHGKPSEPDDMQQKLNDLVTFVTKSFTRTGWLSRSDTVPEERPDTDSPKK